MRQPLTITVDEAAAMLGVCAKTVRRLVADGELRTLKMRPGARRHGDRLRISLFGVWSALGIPAEVCAQALAQCLDPGRDSDGRWSGANCVPGAPERPAMRLRLDAAGGSRPRRVGGEIASLERPRGPSPGPTNHGVAIDAVNRQVSAALDRRERAYQRGLKQGADGSARRLVGESWGECNE